MCLLPELAAPLCSSPAAPTPAADPPRTRRSCGGGAAAEAAEAAARLEAASWRSSSGCPPRPPATGLARCRGAAHCWHRGTWGHAFSVVIKKQTTLMLNYKLIKSANIDANI